VSGSGSRTTIHYELPMSVRFPLFVQTARTIRQRLSTLIAFEVMFRTAAALVVLPLVGWVGATLVSMSGSAAISNDEIAAFLLSPSGAAKVLLLGTLLVATYFSQLAGVVLIVWSAKHGRHMSALAAIVSIGKAFPRLLRLGLLQLLGVLAVLVPGLALLGLTHKLLLSGHDINFYLDSKPPVFWGAVAIGAGIGIVCALLLIWLGLRWLFGSAILIVEGRGPLQALRASAELVRGVRKRLIKHLLIWAAAMLLLASVTGGAGWLLDRALIGIAGEHLSLLIPAIGIVMAAEFAFAQAVGFVAFGSFAVLSVELYFELNDEVIAAPPDEPASTPKLAGWMLWSGVALLLVLAVVTSVGVVAQLEKRTDVEVTAHRGSSRRAPENSLASIRYAIEDGADFAEIDVQETRDGEIVVMHDADLMRIAGLDKSIWEVDYAEIAQLDAGSWFSEEFADEHVPTLDALIDVARGKIKLNIELKYNGHDEQLAQRVIDVVRAQDFASECIITSLDRQGLEEVARLNSELPLGLIVAASVGDLMRIDVDILSLQTRRVTPALLDRAGKHDRQVHVWTVNDPVEMIRFVTMGVDNILTDEPAVLVELLEDWWELSAAERLLLSFRYFDPL
jgi:glycerophosphoryl diester phosphodiesterase